MELTFSPTSLRVLVADDEPHVRQFLRLAFEAEGLEVFDAATIEDTFSIAQSAAPDLIVLDLGFPDGDGQQVIRDLRLRTTVPILVVSGRDREEDKIAALGEGADDYLEKPFSMQHLVARAHAALEQGNVRRTHPHHAVISTGALCINVDEPHVSEGTRDIDLEEDEYTILRLLALNGGRVLTVARIERAIWGEEGGADQRRMVQVRISKLRRKIETQPAFPRYILTEPAVGYRLEMFPGPENKKLN